MDNIPDKPEVCRHGTLPRSCEPCDQEEVIEQLRAKLQDLSFRSMQSARGTRLAVFGYSMLLLLLAFIGYGAGHGGAQFIEGACFVIGGLGFMYFWAESLK